MIKSRPELTTAAALAYDGEGAPRVVAKGQGWLAEQILRKAREAGVPIHDGSGLAHLLNEVELDDEVPAALYVAVAEVLAWVYRLEHPAAT